MCKAYSFQCGGFFSGYQEMGQHHFDLSFPIAEVFADGTAIIQKQPNQNGMYLVNYPTCSSYPDLANCT